MKMTIYLPDELAAEVKAKLGDANVSAICQDALRAEIARQEARARVTADGFERIVFYDSQKGADVAFRGRKIANDYGSDAMAYLTPKGAIVVTDEGQQELYIFDGYQDFATPDWNPGLLAQVAEALGEKYVLELDI